MLRNRIFLLNLIGYVALYAGYGLKRFTLGLDFTDEGAYFAWPLRVALGEKPFSGELLTLQRPVEVFLSVLFKFHPAITVYEFRLIGWSLHLLSFAIFASYLFRLSRSPWFSPLIASIPFFACHIFGIAAPSYNSLASDSLLIALALKGLATFENGRRRWFFEISSGTTLFIATLSHPGLGFVGVVFLVREIWRRQFLINLARRRATPSNAAMLTFVACWALLLLGLAANGALQTWLHRIETIQSLSAKSLPRQPISFALALASHPFTYSRCAMLLSLVVVAALGTIHFFVRRGVPLLAGSMAHAVLFLLIANLIYALGTEPASLTSAFAFASITLAAVAFALPATESATTGGDELRFLILMSGLAAVLLATFTFYFSAHRSWVSGALGLPFVFGAAAARIVMVPANRSAVFRSLLAAALPIAVMCVAWHHYQSIQRDAAPRALVAEFQLPKLRHIKSTEERVRTIEELHDYLQPRLKLGQPLLVYDDCPMLYFLLDARPAYGLTWAVRYTQTPAMLRRLNEEFLANSLPEYAIRTLVDVSHPRWSDAPRTSYAAYPLNETVTTRYELEHTIFPFEIWRLRGAPRKPSITNSAEAVTR